MILVLLFLHFIKIFDEKIFLNHISVLEMKISKCQFRKCIERTCCYLCDCVRWMFDIIQTELDDTNLLLCIEALLRELHELCIDKLLDWCMECFCHCLRIRLTKEELNVEWIKFYVYLHSFYGWQTEWIGHPSQILYYDNFIEKNWMTG